jgi:hypothetical protein
LMMWFSRRNPSNIMMLLLGEKARMVAAAGLSYPGARRVGVCCWRCLTVA